MTYIIVLKVRKFGEDQSNRFWDTLQKPSGWPFFPLPPVQIGLNFDILVIFLNWMKMARLLKMTTKLLISNNLEIIKWLILVVW